MIGPLFLAIGMEPQVGTSSCAFMILWTAFSGVVIYAVDNHLGAQLAIWYAHTNSSSYQHARTVLLS